MTNFGAKELSRRGYTAIGADVWNQLVPTCWRQINQHIEQTIEDKLIVAQHRDALEARHKQIEHAYVAALLPVLTGQQPEKFVENGPLEALRYFNQPGSLDELQERLSVSREKFVLELQRIDGLETIHSDIGNPDKRRTYHALELLENDYHALANEIYETARELHHQARTGHAIASPANEI